MAKLRPHQFLARQAVRVIETMPGDPTGPEPPLAVVRFSADPRAPIRISFLGAPVDAMIVGRESIPPEAGKLATEEWAVAVSMSCSVLPPTASQR